MRDQVRNERVRPLARSLACGSSLFSPYFSLFSSLSLSLSLSLSYHNELPCTNAAYFLGAAIRFHEPHRELRCETEHGVSSRVRHDPTSLAGQSWSEHTCICTACNLIELMDADKIFLNKFRYWKNFIRACFEKNMIAILCASSIPRVIIISRFPLWETRFNSACFKIIRNAMFCDFSDISFRSFGHFNCIYNKNWFIKKLYLIRAGKKSWFFFKSKKSDFLNLNRIFLI